MPETRREAREKMDFNELLKEVKDSSSRVPIGSSKEYWEVRKALEEVVKLSGRPVDRKSATKMGEAHKRLGEACDAYTTSKMGAVSISEKVKDHLEIVEMISNLQKKETNAINAMRDPAKIDENKGKTWSNVLAEQRVTEIDVTGKELSTVGSGSSTRTVVPLENNRKGFFTPDQVLQERNKFLNQMSTSATSENMKKVYANLIKNVDAYNTLCDSGNLALADEDFDISLEQRIEDNPSILDGIIEWKTLCENPADKSKFIKDVKEITKFNTASAVLTDGGVATEANIPIRNVASSRLAALLGQGALLAKSDVASLRNGNEIQKGVIMEAAVGLDWNAREHRETFGMANDFTDPDLQRQISTLEVMDYLACQMDRNIGNMFYQFDKNAPGKLIGVQGIDNDAAFGTLIPEDKRFFEHLVKINGIQLIDQTLADKLKDVDDNTLKYTFGDILNSNEIDALGKRFQIIKDNIGKKKAIKPVKQWNAETAETMAQKNGYMKEIITEFGKKKAALQREQKAAREEEAVQTKANEPKEKAAPSQQVTAQEETRKQISVNELGGKNNARHNFLAAHRNIGQNNATKAPVAQNMKNPTPAAQKR